MRLVDPLAGPDQPGFAPGGQRGASGGYSSMAAFLPLGTRAAEEGRRAASPDRLPAGLVGRSRAPSIPGRREARASVRQRQRCRHAGGCGAETRVMRRQVDRPVSRSSPHSEVHVLVGLCIRHIFYRAYRPYASHTLRLRALRLTAGHGRAEWFASTRTAKPTTAPYAPDDRQSTSGRSLRTTCRRRAAARSHSSFRRPATASTRIVALRSPSALEGSAWNDDETREPCRACGCPRRNEPLSGGANKRARSAASVPAQPQAVAACALYAGHTLPVPHDCPLVLLSGDGPVVMTVGDARTPLAPRRSSLR